jgi:hypothetical protein
MIRQHENNRRKRRAPPGANKTAGSVAFIANREFPQIGEITLSDPDLRQAVFECFSQKCFYTGQVLTIDQMRIDHVIPKSIGGPDNIWNYAPTTHSINSAKTDRFDPEIMTRFLDIIKLAFAGRVFEMWQRLRRIREQTKEQPRTFARRAKDTRLSRVTPDYLSIHSEWFTLAALPLNYQSIQILPEIRDASMVGLRFSYPVVNEDVLAFLVSRAKAQLRWTEDRNYVLEQLCDFSVMQANLRAYGMEAFESWIARALMRRWGFDLEVRTYGFPQSPTIIARRKAPQHESDRWDDWYWRDKLELTFDLECTATIDGVHRGQELLAGIGRKSGTSVKENAAQLADGRTESGPSPF